LPSAIVFLASSGNTEAQQQTEQDRHQKVSQPEHWYYYLPQELSVLLSLDIDQTFLPKSAATQHLIIRNIEKLRLQPGLTDAAISEIDDNTIRVDF
jgi:hypothetical protein